MSWTLALPCRDDEPDLPATLACVAAAWAGAEAAAGGGRVLICLNGGGGESAATALQSWAADRALPYRIDDLDRGTAPPTAAGVHILRTRRPGKANAWNRLRRALCTPTVVFVDADVAFAADVPAALLTTLASHSDAALASARTQPAPRPTRFERLQAVPYRLPFRNLSPQLYAARVDRLPPAMPDDLLEPERWLELILGHERIVHAPGAVVTVRLPATLVDFFRQRIRIEQAKVQLARDYPGLAGRAAPSPDGGAVRATLSATEWADAAAYLGLRTVAHAIGWWRQRRGSVEVAWRQAASTKEWR